MAGIESPSTARKILGEMKVFRFEKPNNPAGFSETSPVGQYYVVKNNKTSEFESYNGSTEKPTFPKIINKKIARQLPVSSLAEGEYLKYYEKKQEHFANWISNYYKRKVEANNTYTLPNFICFSSRLADALDTPCKQRGEWDFHAAKFENSIFLWADPKFYQQRRARNPNKNLPKYGHSFEAVSVGEDPSTSPMDLMSKKPLAVHERTFRNGKYSMLLVSDIDAEDEKDKWVELKTFTKNYVKMMSEAIRPLDKALSCWSQCVVADSQRVIIGQHSKGYLSEDIRDQDLEGFENMAKISKADKNMCYDFLDRLLHFIGEKFDQNPQECCLQFLWNSEEEKVFVNNRVRQDKQLRRVKCIQAPKQEIPEWFKELCMKLTQADDVGLGFNQEEDVYR